MGNILIKQGRTTGPGSTSIIRSKEKDSGKLDGRALERNFEAIKCSPESDGTTTFVQKKEWDEAIENYKFPPYVDCEYVN